MRAGRRRLQCVRWGKRSSGHCKGATARPTWQTPFMDGNERVRTIVRPAGALKEADWQEIWELNREFFDVERWYAENELYRRQHIATFRKGRLLIGMAAIDVFGAKIRGRHIAVILTTNVLL